MNKKIKIFFIIFICIFKLFNTSDIKALNLSTNISEKYTEIQAGDRLYFEIDIKYPENPSRKDLRLNYEVVKDEKIIVESQVLKAVENQASFLDFITVPSDAKTGFYTLKVKISDYENLDEEVSTSFHVVAGKEETLKIYFFILLGVISIVAILVVTNIFLFKKKSIKN